MKGQVKQSLFCPFKLDSSGLYLLQRQRLFRERRAETYSANIYAWEFTPAHVALSSSSRSVPDVPAITLLAHHYGSSLQLEHSWLRST